MTIEKITKELVSTMKEYPVPALETPALNIKRCLLAMARAGQLADEQGIDHRERRKLAQMAYKLHMPPLSDRDSVKANIACIAHGISVGIFTGRDGSQLLYAAQVALSLLKEQKQPGRPHAVRKGRAA